MSTLNKNLRFSWRMLSRNPGMTLTVLLTLALGVGANTAIFTVDYATMLQPLPYPDAKQLVMVWSKIQGFRNVSSVGDFLDWERDSHSFQSMAAWTNGVFNLASGDHPQNVSGLYVTPGYYRVLGLPMFLGREFLPREGHPGQDNVVILSHRMWKRLGGDRDIPGKTLTIDDEPRTVVGVLPAGAYDREEDRIVVPLAFTPEQENHGFHWLLVMGRLKPGVTLQQAQADMDAVTAELARQYPKSNQGWGVQVEPLKHDFISKDEIKTLWLLLGAVGFVLLIACLNVANLLMARSMTRQREMAIRAALGAGARAIFAQLLVESLMLAMAGGAMGLGVGYAMLQGLMAA